MGDCEYRQPVNSGQKPVFKRISRRKIMLNLLPLAFVVKWDDIQNVLVSTVIFVALGLVVFALAFFFITVLAPFSVKKEIEEDQNTSLAILIGSVFIAIALIISAAIHG
jgi:putative membrane protein